MLDFLGSGAATADFKRAGTLCSERDWFSPTLCCVRPVTPHLLWRHHSTFTLSSRHMFHLPRINLTQRHVSLPCLVPWDTTTEKHALLARMRCSCGAKWELIAAIKILYLQQMSQCSRIQRYTTPPSPVQQCPSKAFINLSQCSSANLLISPRDSVN